MTARPVTLSRLFGPASLSLLLLPTQLLAQALIVQPGAPGAPSRELSADEASQIAGQTYTEADVRFMQAMIPHHQQALEMAELVEERTNRSEIRDVAGRIDVSQEDEIGFMRDWLEDRGEAVPQTPGEDHDADSHAAMEMPEGMVGMATAEQMAALAAADGTDFDRLFLELMIAHHEGAVTMVQELQGQPGAAYDPVLFEFTNDVRNDQTAEIGRMTALAERLSDDPRVGLDAGFDDADEAIWNLKLVGSLPRPPGFFDPENPAELPPQQAARGGGPGGRGGNGGNGNDDDDANNDEAAANAGRSGRGGGRGNAGGRGNDDQPLRPYNRNPLLDFGFTDMAFLDDVLIAGSYHGFNIYRLRNEALPELVSSVVCPGGQGDVSVVGHLLIMSVEQTRGRVDCGRQGVIDDVSDERFRGIRIFDISDLARPVQVGAVQTCRGSHTHSVVSGPGDDGIIVVYNSGTSSIRDEEEMAGCIGAVPGDDRTALFRIDVIEIPVADPSLARIVDSPAVFADEEEGILAGLWRGGDHGDETQSTRATDQCHDITVFPAKNLAAGACSGNGILFDITDPLQPKRIDAVLDTGFAYWHSATFNNDGTKVIFTDEWGGGSRPRCRVQDPLTWGADAIYDIVDSKLVFRGYYKMPAPQTEQENCVAHNGAIIPVPGRDLFVQAWYQGGISIIDFTDSANPVEIAFFDRGPINGDVMIGGGYWSAYYYQGLIYGTEIVRGLDVFELDRSEFLSDEEIAAAAYADLGGVFNPQQQLPASWPDEPVIARAYLAQLERAEVLERAIVRDVDRALTRAGWRLEDDENDPEIAAALESLAAGLPTSNDTIATRRLDALADSLRGIAGRLRSGV